MKNILAIVMVLTPLVSFSSDAPKTKRVVGFMMDIIKQSDEQTSAAVYGSAPQAESYMRRAYFPPLTRTVSEPVSTNEVTRALHDQQVKDPTLTDCNKEFLHILFSAPVEDTQPEGSVSCQPESPVLLRRNTAIIGLASLDTYSGSDS